MASMAPAWMDGGRHIGAKEERGESEQRRAAWCKGVKWELASSVRHARDKADGDRGIRWLAVTAQRRR
jgi:hypothetical protein